MKAEILPNGSLKITAEGTYESLALDAWYDYFFRISGRRNIIPEGKDKPMLLVEYHHDDET